MAINKDATKATVRHVAEHDRAVDDLTRQMAERRELMYNDLVEAEAVVKALTAGIARIDGLIHLAPRHPGASS